MKFAIFVFAPVVEVCRSLKVNAPRGLKVWSCKRSSRTRRMSAPHLMVWLPVTLVQVFTASMFDSARIHGTEAEYPMSGLEKPPLMVMPTCPEVKGWSGILTPGTPMVVASSVP